MPMISRHIPVLTVLVLAACALAGCGTVNEKLSAGMADYIPAWAGGLPADAPPRAGTPEYDAFMRERERKRLLPASERGDDAKDATKPAASSTQGTAKTQ